MNRLRTALRLAPLALFAPLTLFACSTELAPISHETSGTSADELTGGEPATEAEFPATIYVAGTCTAAKVGPRHILLAAHCVHDANNNTVRFGFLPGQNISITSANSTQDSGAFQSVRIAQTHIFQDWLDTCVTPCGVNVLNPSHPPDLAVIELETDTPNIAEASVDLSPVNVGDPVVMTGYGCENGLEGPFGDFGARFKLEHVDALPASALLHSGSYVGAGDEGNVAASYVITPGFSQSSAAASLCPGDSGGPLYRDDAEQLKVIGVNAYYTFLPNSGGISYTNWHTRLDTDARFAVSTWLEQIGVNISGDNPDGGDCDGIPAWDPNADWTSYEVGTQRTRGGNLYECHTKSWCYIAPDDPNNGQLGWSLVRECGTSCVPECSGKQCGSDGCGGSCGTCGSGESCDAAGQCQSTCVPECSGKQCGSDGCGGSCGTCGSGESCDAAGQCQSTCVPECSGKQCGSDGCGGSCGTCGSGESCDAAGQCVGSTGCSGVSAWDPNKPWYNYSVGEQNVQGGQLYECTNIAYCIYDPSGPYGHFGWTNLGPC